jgi:3-methyladenine DNA glycosylase AlkD
MIETLVADLRQALQAAAGREPRIDSRNHKGYRYLSFRLYTADFRRVLRAFKERFLVLSLDERLDLAGQLLAAGIGELGHAGIHVLALSVAQLSPEHLPILDRLCDHLIGWSQVDQLCIDVIQPLLWAFRQDTLDLLESWNHSPNPWKRRASVVAFSRKVGESGEFTEEALRLCESLVWDHEDLVQKGVGWALKDNLRSAPQPIVAYVKDLRRRGVPSTITLYAIRDLRGALRQEVLDVTKDRTR